jgi:hypothetical protein
MHRIVVGQACVLAVLVGCGGQSTPSSQASAAPPADSAGQAQMAGDAREASAASASKAPAAAKAGPRAKYASVRIDGIPHVRQKPDFCGEACGEMVLRKLGHQTDQDFVFDQAGLDPLEGRGCYTKDLARALGKIGFRVGPVWHKVAVRDAARQLEAQWAALHADLQKQTPSIVCMHYNDQPGTTEHFRLVVGYDAARDEILYHEPAEDNGAYRRMSRSEFMKLWPLKYEPDEWTVIRMRLEPGAVAASPAARTPTSADYAQHIRTLKRKLPSDDFRIVLQPPFVVVGDESAAAVRHRATGTIQWAVDRLKADYFSKDPSEIIDIWLFKDKPSYETYVKKVFGESPTTPFGYYSPRHRALIMNIATGGGTLVHEIVHPFVASNFPNCPSWFNEGLGSLYEQCGDQDGRIHGYTNWRLAGLQRAIRADSVPSFKTLCSTTRNGFYTADPGTNYSQARYLCYYLQQHGLLAKFYHQFHKNAKDDPSGYQTLQTVLAVDDMSKWQEDWEAYVMKLKFP